VLFFFRHFADQFDVEQAIFKVFVLFNAFFCFFSGFSDGRAALGGAVGLLGM
jgi:hypothetical protein